MVAGQPLTGYRVLDLTMNMSGPMATMMLADQGADVIKIESPAGDPIRHVGSGSPGLSAYFANLNRNKRSVVLDLQTEAGRAAARLIAGTADVVVQNFRVGVAERLGVGPCELCSAHPQLVYVSISGFGRVGPLSDAPAYDHVIQAMSGLAARQAGSDGVPAMVRHGVVDKATGYVAAQAVTAALLERARTGVGAQIDISMLDVALAFLWPDGMMDRTCEQPERQLPPIAGSFRLTPTADGFVALVTLTDRQWLGLLAAAGIDADERAASVAGRMEFGAETMRQVRRRLSTTTTEEVVKAMRAHDVPCAAVVGLDAVASQDQVVAAGSVQRLLHPVLGAIHQPRQPARWEHSDDRLLPAPALGQHTDEVLAEIGLLPDRPATTERGGHHRARSDSRP